MTKVFGQLVAVNDISLRVEQADVVALLGPNGAGKTTTIEMCEGFIHPTSGNIRVLGTDPTAQPDDVRRRIGIMLQGGGAYPGIRVREMLNLVASYSANPMDTEWLLDMVGLSKHSRTSYRRLSGGQQQRLSLACALVGRPELVFPDEPTAGMDAQSRHMVWDLMCALRNDGVSVVLTTHFIDEAEALANHVYIMDKGTIVASGTPTELTSAGGYDSGRINFETASALDVPLFDAAINNAVSAAPALRTHVNRPLVYRIDAAVTPQLLRAIASAAEEQNVLIKDLSVDHRSLEDVFLDITGREMRI